MAALSALAQYGDNESEDGDEGPDEAVPLPSELKPQQFALQTAPDVDIALEKEKRRQYPIIAPSTEVVYHNPRYEDMYAPEQGPLAPHQHRRTGKLSGGRNHHLGDVQPTNMHTFAFDDQYHGYNKAERERQASAAESKPGAAGPSAAAQAAEGLGALGESGAPRPKAAPGAAKRRRLRPDDPFSPYEFALSRDDSKQLERTPEEQAIIDARDKDRAAQRARADEGGGLTEEKSIFHGKSLTDYQGRTYMHPPAEIRSARAEHENFLPTQLVHTFPGHTKGVSAIRYLPKWGHLLLSAGMDHKVKLWDVCTSRTLLRSYLGHAAAVRDICFSNDGRRFLTCSYDRYCKLWDTETGQCLGAFTTKKLPYCVKFNPDEDKQNIFMVGQADKQVVQWDISSNQPVQFYNHHLGAVNTVTFCDGNRRIVSTADDKKVLVWEYGIPVPIKQISEPHMHSIPYMTVHPNEKWLLGQSMDNQIVVYGVHNRFRQHNKKIFKGHLNAGYACQIDVSPDGQFVASGDADGRCFFWDWKTTRVFRKLRCHDGVCIGATWHPLLPSQVATCGWDGTIKLWE